MCGTIETVAECLGKPVVDPYGRRIGFVASFYSDVDGKVKSLEVNVSDEEFKEVPIERFNVTPEGIVLVPEYEYNAIAVENRLKLVKSRLASLEELYSRKDVPMHVYENFKKKLEDELANIKARAKEVKDALRARLHEVEEQIAEIEKAITSLKTSYIAGEIPERPYLTALDIMKKSLEVFLKEKDSIRKHIDKIESLEALPISPAISIQQIKEEVGEQKQPVNVVVVE
ncbi:MAG: CdvA-like protein [Desulfurococcaceae archaeon]